MVVVGSCLTMVITLSHAIYSFIGSVRVAQEAKDPAIWKP